MRGAIPHALPELLAPAGSTEALDAAFGEGADAVYLGLHDFNARLRGANFTYAQLEAALKTAHRQNRKIYVAVNTVFIERETDRMYQLLQYLADVGADGAIVQDLGVVEMARTHFPSLHLHASTQMNVASARGCNALSRHGVSRVVLARELSLEDVRRVRAGTNVELEVFVHGALCVSASGLCLFSSYLGGKSANRGLCTQACRRRYTADDKRSAYYFSPRDLQLLDDLSALIDAGVNALKIEGRMKSAEYVGTVTRAYRMALDALAAGADTPDEARRILTLDFARKKTRFHFTGNDTVDYLSPDEDGGTGIKLGVIARTRGSAGERHSLLHSAPLEPHPGDSVRLHKADDSARATHKLAAVERDAGGGIWLDTPDGFDEGDSVYLVQTKALSRHYPPVVPRDVKAFKRKPGFDKAPAVTLKAPEAAFPEGLYVSVERIEDLYLAQAARPAGAILSLNSRTAARLLGDHAPIPFGRERIILRLDPFFPEGQAEDVADWVDKLASHNWRNFMACNLGHFSLLRQANTRRPLNILAGPELYAFNRHAGAFLFAAGANALVAPLESARQSLERAFDNKRERAAVFVTLFAWPRLFSVQSDVHHLYDFTRFTDARDEEFLLCSGNERSFVLPARPFSIVDKLPFLQQAGFTRFIVDFGPLPVQKKVFREVVKSLETGAPVSDATRFNWKDGFYTPQETTPAARGGAQTAPLRTNRKE